jgi:RNA polymerase sigma factor (sigma-70 family)
MLGGPGANSIGQDVKEAFFTPLATVPHVSAQDVRQTRDVLSGNVPTNEPEALDKIVAGAQNSAADLVSGITSPFGLATLGLGGLPAQVGKQAAKIFAVWMASEMPDQAHAFNEALKKGDEQGASKAATDFLLTGVMAGAAGAHGFRKGLGALNADEILPPDSQVPAVREKGAASSNGPVIDVESVPLDTKPLTIDIGDGREIIVRPKAEPPAPAAPRQLDGPTIDVEGTVVKPEPVGLPGAPEILALPAPPEPKLLAAPKPAVATVATAEGQGSGASIRTPYKSNVEAVPAPEPPKTTSEWTYEGEQASGMAKESLAQLPPELAAKYPKSWAFTDRRPGSPTEGYTTYVKIGSTRAEVDAHIANKASEIVAANTPDAHPVVKFAESQQAMEVAKSVASGYAKQLGLPMEDLAVDGVSQLFLDAPKHNGSEVVPWSKRVLHNYFRDQLRKRDPLRQADRLDAPVEGAAPPESVSPENTPAEVAEASEMMRALQSAKEKLTPVEKAIIESLEGTSKMTHSDIAKVEGVTPSAISQRLPGIRAKIAAGMKDAGVDPSDWLTVKEELAKEAEPSGMFKNLRGKEGERTRRKQQQGGFIRPGLLLDALTRIVTPIWRAGRSLAQAMRPMVRMFGNAIMPHVRRVWTRLYRGGSTNPYVPKGPQRVVQKYLTPKGLAPAEAFRLTEQKNFAEAEIVQAAEFYAMDAVRAGINDHRAAATAVLEGRQPVTSLPVALRAPVQAMRTWIDSNSSRMIGMGIPHANQVASFLQGMGSYLNRSYQVHTDKNWMSKVPEARREAAIRLVMQNANVGRDRAMFVINELLLNQKSGDPYRQSGVTGSKDLGILAERQVIDRVIRELYGENTDPVVNFAATVRKQGQMMVRHQFQQDLRAAGLGRFLFTEADARGDFAARIPGDNPALRELTQGQDLYTTPDILEALKLMPSSNNPAWLQWVRRASNAVNWNLTVGSLKSAERNLMSNVLIAVSLGNFRLAKVMDAVKTNSPDRVRAEIQKHLGWGNNANARREVLKLIRLGVIESVNASAEQAERVKDAGDDITDSTLQRLARKNAVVKAVAGAKGAMDWAWATGDNLFRVFNYHNFVEDLKWAEPNRPIAEIEAEAAEMVRDLTPTYSRAPKAVQALRTVPLVGTFFTYRAEAIRTQANNVARAVEEVGRGGRYATLGVKRLIGIIGAVSAITGLAAYTAKKYLGDNSEEKEKAFRRFVQSYMKNADMIFYKNDQGQLGYADASFLDPYKTLKEPIMAMANGKSTVQGLISALDSASEPFVSESVMSAMLTSLKRNKTEDGRQIYNEGDSAQGQVVSALKWIANNGGVPRTIIDAKRVYHAYTGTPDFMSNAKGRIYDKESELRSLLGVRSQTVDIEAQLGFNTYDHNAGIKNAEKLFEVPLISNGKMDQKDLSAAWDKMIERRSYFYKEIIEDVKAAKLLDVPEAKIRKKLEAARVPDVSDIMKGRVPKYKASSGLRRMSDDNEAWRRQKLNQLEDSQK